MLILICALPLLAVAQISFYPSIDVGGQVASNYYLVSSPNTNVNSYLIELGNKINYFGTSWFSLDVDVGGRLIVDQESKGNNITTYDGAITPIISPIPELKLKTSFQYYQYDPERFVSSNVQLAGISEQIYWYFSPSHYIYFSGSFYTYDYTKSKEKSEKQTYSLGYQLSDSIYYWGSYSLMRSDDISEYNNYDIGINGMLWISNQQVLSLDLTYSNRDYLEAWETDESLDIGGGFRYYFNKYWSMSIDVNYYKELMKDGIDGTQISVSFGYSDVFNSNFNRTDRRESDYVFDDAMDAIDNNQLDKAASLLDRVLFFDSTHVEALFERAYIYHTQKKYQLSIPLFRQVIALDPEQDAAYQLLAHNLIKTNDRESAINVLRQLYRLTNDNKILNYINSL